MKKVTIEITEEGWTTTIQLGERVFTEHHEKTALGAESIEGDFENEDDLPEELYYAVSALGQFDVMKELGNIK